MMPARWLVTMMEMNDAGAVVRARVGAKRKGEVAAIFRGEKVECCARQTPTRGAR
jgi:hypothetical protein